MIGAFGNDMTLTNDDVGLEATDTPKKDFAMLNDAALETAHESETQIVDCDEVCMMRDFMEVDSNPNSCPRIERFDDPEEARLVGSNEAKECELKLKPCDKTPDCTPIDTTELKNVTSTPFEVLQLALVSEIQMECSKLVRPIRTAVLPARVPKLDPETIHIREPVEGKFFWLSPRREIPRKMGASKENKERELETWECTVTRTGRCNEGNDARLGRIHFASRSLRTVHDWQNVLPMDATNTPGDIEKSLNPKFFPVKVTNIES